MCTLNPENFYMHTDHIFSTESFLAKDAGWRRDKYNLQLKQILLSNFGATVLLYFVKLHWWWYFLRGVFAGPGCHWWRRAGGVSGVWSAQLSGPRPRAPPKDFLQSKESICQYYQSGFLKHWKHLQNKCWANDIKIICWLWLRPSCQPADWHFLFRNKKIQSRRFFGRRLKTKWKLEFF